MKRRDFLKTIAGSSGLALAGTPAMLQAEPESEDSSSLADRTFYELRRYRFSGSDEREPVKHHLRDAVIPAYNRMGVKPVGVFEPVSKKPEETKEAPDRELIVLFPFPTMEHLLRARLELHEDDEYRKQASSFLNTSEKNFPYDRYGSRLLVAFSGFPELKPPAGEETDGSFLYELRTYEQYSEEKSRLKVDMMNKHVIDLFNKLGFRSVFYGNTLYGDRMPSLTYMLAFESREERKKLWGDFGGSDEWQRLSGMEKYKNTVSEVHNQFLRAVPYSQV